MQSNHQFLNLFTSFATCIFEFVSRHQWTPLHVAADNGHKNILEYLVKKPVDINIKDDDGVSIYKTILH